LQATGNEVVSKNIFRVVWFERCNHFKKRNKIRVHLITLEMSVFFFYGKVREGKGVSALFQNFLGG